ncbi:taste receptor type 2 member 4-like [Dendropsophus ebraccatus]|uniref:taste receptor type 2 member 4-like n=1 Tax=Dendropsophus ebraccatus TaxID=150705 RepID=UPI0038312B74
MQILQDIHQFLDVTLHSSYFHSLLDVHNRSPESAEDIMLSLESIFLLTVNSFLIFLGLLLNLFIVVMNVTWWLKGKALQSIDIIMTSLGSVRIVLLVIYFYLSLPLLFSDTDTYARFFVMIFMLFCSLWWSTVLGVFYCVKITTYTNRLFMRLQINISAMVPWMLLGSVVISFVSTLPLQTFTDFTDGNFSNYEEAVAKEVFCLIIISSAGSIVPILIFCVSICLLIVSLLKHTRNMNGNNSGFAKPQLEAHKNAIVTMVSFLLFYLLQIISWNMLIFNIFTENTTYYYLCSIFVSSYPSLHSILLIASNAKLKRSLLSAFPSILSHMFMCANNVHTCNGCR